MSPITPPCTVTRAPRPIVTWSASPAWPARKTSSSTWVLPAIPAWPAMRQRAPMRQLCPICTRLSILVPGPTTVSSTLPRSIVVLAPIHVVPDDAATHLGNLARHLAVLPRDVAEAVRAESHARVQNDAVAHDRAAVAHHLRQQLDVVAELHAVSQHGRGADPHVLAEAHAPAEHRVGTDRHRLLPDDAFADHRRPVDPRPPGRLGIEHGDDREQRDVGIAHHHPARRPRARVVRHEVRLAEHDGRARLLKILEIALRGKK